jgi:hypothetical protein
MPGSSLALLTRQAQATGARPTTGEMLQTTDYEREANRLKRGSRGTQIAHSRAPSPVLARLGVMSW